MTAQATVSRAGRVANAVLAAYIKDLTTAS